MTISLTLVPNTTTRPGTIDAIAMGLGGGTRYNVRLDGSTIATARATKGGVLAVGVAISSTARFGSHTVELRDSANQKTLATAAFTVAAAPPPVQTVPSAPLGLAGLAGDGSASLSWAAPSSDGGAPVLHYRVYQGTTFLTTSSDRLHTDTGLTNGTAYAYSISAVNSVGEGSKSAAVTVTPFGVIEPPPPPPPPPPTGTEYRIPGSIDHSGQSDVYQVLGNWIASLPNGADAAHPIRIVPYDAQSKYLIVSENPTGYGAGFQTLRRNNISLFGGGQWRDRRKLDEFYPDPAALVAARGNQAAIDALWAPHVALYRAFDVNAEYIKGAEIIHRSPGQGGFSAAFSTMESKNIDIFGWTIDGGDANVGKPHGPPNWEVAEQRSPLYIRYGSDGVSFHDNLCLLGAGFGVWGAAESGHVAAVPKNVSDHHNWLDGYETHPGIVSVIGWESHHNVCRNATGAGFDLEPERAGETLTDAYVHDSVYDTYGWGGEGRSIWLFTAVCADAATATVKMDRVKVQRLLIPRGLGDPTKGGNYPGQGGLSFRANGANVKNDFEVSDCYSLDDQTMASGGGRASIKVANIRNLKVVGNTQKLSGGAPFLLDEGGLVNAVLGPNP